MPSFDFISSRDFRHSLESDYAEMLASAASGSWKSVQVLAGSIVEALLVDYLLATNEPPRSGKDLLKIDLAEAVEVCHREGILTARSAELSSVVRSYRNLIHPARIVRLKEDQPSKASGTIAMALVDLIVAEVEKRRQEKFGLTAEQLLSKIERDHNCLPLLKHLLVEVSGTHQEKLLLELLPARYLELVAQDEADFLSDESLKRGRLEKAYRIIHDLVPEPMRRKAAASFVRVLREADGHEVATYQEAFFAAEDIGYLAAQHVAIVKEYFLSLTKGPHTPRTADVLARLAPYLEVADIKAWVDPFVRAAVTNAVDDGARELVEKAFLRGFWLLPANLETALTGRITEWEKHFTSKKQEEERIAVHQLLQRIEDQQLPF